MIKMEKKRRPAILFILFVAAVLTLIILSDADLLPTNVLALIPRYDLIGHFLIYGLMARLLDDFAGQRKWRAGRHLIPVAVAIPIAFSLLEEFSQIFFPSRTFSLMDLWFGFQGIYVFYRRYPEKLLSTIKKKNGKPA